jgi:hypothetical protein
MFNKIFAYQYSNLDPFKRTLLTYSVDVSVKTQLDDSQFTDGSARVNGTDRDKKQDYNPQIEFLLDRRDDFFTYKKAFLGEPDIMFFVAMDADGGVRVLWNYASCEGFQESYPPSESYGQHSKLINAKFRLFKPFYYEADDDDIVITNFDSVQRPKYDTTVKYDATTTYDQVEVTSTTYLRDYTMEQRRKLFYTCRPTVKLSFKDRWFKKVKTNKTYNYLTYTEDMSNAVWVKNNVTATINGGASITGNTDATLITVATTPVDAYLSQANLISPRGQNTFSILVKQGTVGNATHIQLSQNNATDGTATGNLVAITAGVSVGDGWYRHTFSRTTTLQNFNTVFIRFRTSAGAQPTAGSTIFVDNPSYFCARIVSTLPNFQPVPDQYIDPYINLQNSFSYTITGNTTYYNLNSKPLNLETTMDSDKLVLRLQKLSITNYIEVYNLTNNTGLRITWKSAISSPDVMLLYTSNLELYNGVTGQLIPAYSGSYKLEPLGIGTLSFRPLYSTGEFVDVIRVIKDTPSNYNITIKQLKTFH